MLTIIEVAALFFPNLFVLQTKPYPPPESVQERSKKNNDEAMKTDGGSIIRNHILFLSLYLSTGFSYSDDLNVLLKLKDAMLAVPGGDALRDWTNSTSPSAHCFFSGISCNEDARVVSISITNVRLFGHIPPEISLLTRLVNLTLSEDNLTNGVPVEMASLTSLRFLNLSANLLNSSFPGEILKGMTELEVLDVYNNNFSGTLPPQVAGLSKLRHLSFGGNFFSGDLPEVFSEVENLEFLGVQGTYFSSLA